MTASRKRGKERSEPKPAAAVTRAPSAEQETQVRRRGEPGRSATGPNRTPPNTPANASAADSVLAELRCALDEIRSKSPWRLLNLEPGCPAEEAKKAFFRVSKRYHPHIYARYDSAEISGAATELFILYKRAYETVLKTAAGPKSTGGTT